MNVNAENYVAHYYSTNMFRQCYAHNILPLNGIELWPEVPYIKPVPPKKRRLPGRPTIKRKIDQSEREGRHTVSKVGSAMKCSLCKKTGHNMRRCPTNPAVQKKEAQRAAAKRVVEEVVEEPVVEGEVVEEPELEEEVVEEPELEEEVVEEPELEEVVVEEPELEAEVVEEPLVDAPMANEHVDAEPDVNEPVHNEHVDAPAIRKRKSSERIIKMKLGKRLVGSSNIFID